MPPFAEQIRSVNESDGSLVKEPPFKSIAIIGLGLIGASLAGAVRMAWPSVRIAGVDTDEATRTQAVRERLVDDAWDGVGADLEQYLGSVCDLVVLAVPVDAAASYFSAIGRSGYDGIVTDTASTKERMCRMAAELLSEPRNFVPGHPMAGSEINGIQGARADLFQGAYWILCPDADTPPDFIPALHDFVCGLGARSIVISRQDHDKAVAVVSHVPHIVASSLVTLAADAAGTQGSIMRLAAGGFKDTTRIAAGSPGLWCGIAFDNMTEVLEGIRTMQEILGSFADALEKGDRETMTALLSKAADVRKALPAAWVPSSDRLLEVRVLISNHPGAVAEATAIASEAGCNIQSIEIDHVTEDRAYLSLVLTDEGDVGRLSAELIGSGYAVSFAPIGPWEHAAAQ